MSSVNGVGGQNGANQTTQTTHNTVTTQSGSPTVGTSTGTPEPTEENVPVVGGAAEESSDLPPPDPDSDPGAYAEALDQKANDYEDLMALREQLEYLAEHGDAKAQELIGKIDAVLKGMGLGTDREREDFQNELEAYVEYLPNSDLDGDGVINRLDPDIDGDGLTNAAELALGTDPNDIDTDHDGITDYGELWLKQHNYELTWLDPLSADADGNGQIDSLQIPSTITVDNNGFPIRVGAQPGTPGASGTDGTGTASAPLMWGPPSADAQTATWGDSVDASTGDVVVTLSGEDIELSTINDGKDLVITNGATGETITVLNYKEGKQYFEGTSGAISTNNFSAGNLNGIDSNGDGYADAGVHFASGMNTASIENNYDPFNGSMPIDAGATTDEEVVYNCNGAAGAFELPASMGGNVVEITFEGNDVVVTVKGEAGGEPIKKFRLKNGKTAVENGDITFKGTDEADYFTSEGKVTIYGGKGDDLIEVGAGSTVYGEEGNDYLVANGTANGTYLDGGDGDDVLAGSDGVDTMIGGKGMDAVSTGNSTGDTIDTGAGDDILIVGDTSIDADYNVEMGGGYDMTNWINNDAIEGDATHHGIDIRMDDMGGLMSYLAGRTDEASGVLLEELIKAGDMIGNAAEMASDTVKSAFLTYLMKRKSNMESDFGTNHAAGPDENTDIPPPDSGS